MEVFLGGIYHTGIARPGSGSIHLRMTERVRPRFVLESFHYMDQRMARMIRHNGQQIFLDSGAYSAHTQGVRISLREYADFIRDNADIISVAANLDMIGPGLEQWSYKRQKALETMLASDGLDQLVMPVHHLRDHDDWLRRYLDEGYGYIGLGGMVKQSSKTVRRWLDHVWHYYLTKPDGTPKIKVHGFGLTSSQLMFRFPWGSVDSTSWMHTSRYGGVLMDFHFSGGAVGDYRVDFSDRSKKRFDPNSWHYRSLVPADRKKVDQRLAQLEAERIRDPHRDPEVEADFKAEFGCKMGFNPEALGLSYGLRDLANIGYYHRAMDRRVDRFEHRQDG
jgi:hypothetical protein